MCYVCQHTGDKSSVGNLYATVINALLMSLPSKYMYEVVSSTGPNAIVFDVFQMMSINWSPRTHVYTFHFQNSQNSRLSYSHFRHLF